MPHDSANRYDWTPLPGALVTVLLGKDWGLRRTAMVVDVRCTNFIVVEMLGTGRSKGRRQLRFVRPEQVIRRQPDMFSIGTDAVLWHRRDNDS